METAEKNEAKWKTRSSWRRSGPISSLEHRLEKEVRPQELCWSSKKCFCQGKMMACEVGGPCSPIPHPAPVNRGRPCWVFPHSLLKVRIPQLG